MSRPPARPSLCRTLLASSCFRHPLSQVHLSAMLALATSSVFTAAIALVTLATKPASRAINLTGVAIVIALAVAALQRSHIRINFTASMPMGIYSLSPLPPNSVRRGMLVAACAPARAAGLGLQRGYLAVGHCAHNTELLLKSVAATAGDDVSVTSVGVTVNGCLLPLSRPIAQDRSGRQLSSWPTGYYRLASRQVWLYAASARSWDSRYWGPVSVDTIVSEAAPLFVFRPARAVNESPWKASHDMRQDRL
jgi:conjugative transfer signal peptidase TraF